MATRPPADTPTAATPSTVERRPPRARRVPRRPEELSGPRRLTRSTFGPRALLDRLLARVRARRSDDFGASTLDFVDAPAPAQPPLAPIEAPARRSMDRVPAANVAPTRRPALVIHRLRLWQPVGAEPSSCFESDDDAAIATVRAGAPFAIACELRLSGHGAFETAAGRPRYRVRYIVENLGSGSRLHLGHSVRGNLSSDQSMVLTRLKLVSLPRGTYRLIAIANVEEARAQPSKFEIGLLEVM